MFDTEKLIIRLEGAGLTSEQAQIITEGIAEASLGARAKPKKKKKPLTEEERVWIYCRLRVGWVLIIALILTEAILNGILIFHSDLPEPLDSGTFTLLLIAAMLAFPMLIVVLWEKNSMRKRSLLK